MTKKTKRETAVLIIALIAAAITWTYHGPVSVSARDTHQFANYKPMGVENPRIHWERVEDARKTQYESTGRNIFEHELPPPPPPPPVHTVGPGDADYVPPPPLPVQLPLKFLGYGTVTGGTRRRAFLGDGDTVYVVAEGETLLGRFRIIRIGNQNLEFEDAASGRHGTAVLEEKGPAI